MHYIPQLTADVITQVPEDKNSYINIRNIGASGVGDTVFTGNVLSTEEGIVTIGDITGPISEYLKQGVQLQVFSYGPLASIETPNINISSHTIAGNIDFSTSSSQNSNLAELKYIVYGLDVNKGVVANYKQEYIVTPGPTITSKIVNPSQWNLDQYVQLNLSRTSSSILPILFRVWGNSFKLLGVIGNNKVGYGSTTIQFKDYGDTEISVWEGDPELPSFLTDIFSIGGGQVSLTSKLKAKENLEILPLPIGVQTNYIQCSGLSSSSLLSTGDTVKFTIDDTKFIQQAVNLAAGGAIKDIFFPAGVYSMRDTFFLNSPSGDYSNLVLRGVGDGTIIKRLPCTPSNVTYPGLINFSGQSLNPRIFGIKLRSLAFNGNRGECYSVNSPLTSEVTVQLQNCDGVVVNECTFFDNGGGGLIINNSNSLNVSSNKIIRSGRAYEQPVSPLIISQSENAIVQGNIFEYSTTSPKVTQTDYSLINSNIIRGCGDRGLILESSFQWNAQGNVAYSDNDSIINFIDTYNNSYSRAAIEVRKGFSLDPVYMTVTYAGESVRIAKNSIDASIYTLNIDSTKNTKAGSFKVSQTADQLSVGIFSLSMPGGISNLTVDSKVILATGNLNNANGYMYEVKGTIVFGQFKVFSISSVTINSVAYNSIKLLNPSDMLGFQVYSSISSNSDITANDKIQIYDFSNTDLGGLNPNSYYPIVSIDVDNNSLLIAQVVSLSEEVKFLGGNLSIARSDYFIADGNLIVHSGV